MIEWLRYRDTSPSTNDLIGYLAKKQLALESPSICFFFFSKPATVWKHGRYRLDIAGRETCGTTVDCNIYLEQ